MRLVIDLQEAQSQSRFREIERYNMSLAKAIALYSGEHEIILALSDKFPDTIIPIRHEFNGLIHKERIAVFAVPGFVGEKNPDNIWRTIVADKIRKHSIKELRPDVVLATNLFEGHTEEYFSLIEPSVSPKNTAVILYDLMPFVNRDDYFGNKNKLNWYMRKIDSLKASPLLLSTSEYTRQEAIKYLGIDKNKIINISAAASDKFKPIKCDNIKVANLKERYKILRPFIMYGGDYERGNNIERLIEAFSLLQSALQDKYDLILVGKYSSENYKKLFKYIKRNNVDKNVIFIDYIPDDDLVYFYNMCSLFVMPSINEGFRVAAIEAMACGAPTIGSNCMSIQEMIGRDGAIFDPYSVESIASAIIKVLIDENYKQDLKKYAIKKAASYSWDFSARKAMEAFKALSITRTNEETIEKRSNSNNYSKYKLFINDLGNSLLKINKINDFELEKIAICIEKNEHIISRFRKNKELPRQILWRIEGPFDSTYSLALLNRETAKALRELGHTVLLHSTEGPGDFVPNHKFLNKNPDIANFYQESLKYSPDQCDVVSRNIYPPRVSDMSGRLNLLHLYAWEESALPIEWVKDFNDFIQGIACLSKHVEKVLIDNGIIVPLSFSGCGVDHLERIIPSEKYIVPGKTFKFLHVSSCFPRKGVDCLLEAYGRSFNLNDEVSLIIKTFANPHNTIKEQLSKIKKGNSMYPDVIIIDNDLSDSEIKALYLSCDALVAPSRAEGFGLPMAEAMLSDLPVITTAWGGQLDFCNEMTSWLINYDFAYAATHFNLLDSIWAEPDVGHLASIMRTVFNLPLAIRKEKATAGKKLLLDQFRWIHVAERLAKSARYFSTTPKESESRIGWITSWNSRCGIAKYSEHLLNELDYPIQAILASNTDDRIADDQENVIRCWNADNKDNLEYLDKTINILKLNTIIIQFNYGFFNFCELSKFIEKQLDYERIVIIVLHSTTDPESDPTKKLKYLKNALNKCQRLLVHSINDMNRLKGLGLVDNITLFPHGIINTKPVKVNLGQLSKKFLIASYGFFLPNKGLLELLEAISILSKSDLKVHLLMVNAEYPSSDSKKLIIESKRIIDILGITKLVSIITDYIPDALSLGYLENADLIIFPYQKTGESSSAAVRGGLAATRPVAVTPLAIFDDVAQVVIPLPGITPKEIAQGIEAYIYKIKNGDDEIMRIQERARQWRKSHLYSEISQRLKGIIIALQRKKDNHLGHGRDSMDNHNNILTTSIESLENEIDHFINEVDKKIKVSLHDDVVREYFSTYILALPAFVWAGVKGLGLNPGKIELSTRCAGSG